MYSLCIFTNPDVFRYDTEGQRIPTCMRKNYMLIFYDQVLASHSAPTDRDRDLSDIPAALSVYSQISSVSFGRLIFHNLIRAPRIAGKKPTFEN
jgi:ferredoxin